MENTNNHIAVCVDIVLNNKSVNELCTNATEHKSLEGVKRFKT